METVCHGSNRCVFVGACFAYARQLGQLAESGAGGRVEEAGHRILLETIAVQSRDCPTAVIPKVYRSLRHPIHGVTIWPACAVSDELRSQAQGVLLGAHPYLGAEVARQLVGTH